MLILNKNDVQIILSGTNDKDEPISIHYDYTKTGLLTFDRTKSTILMTVDAIEKRRVEAYDKAHPKK